MERKSRDWEEQSARFHEHGNLKQEQTRKQNKNSKWTSTQSSGSMFEGLSKEQQARLMELFFGGTYSFMGSYTIDSNKKLKQELWLIKSKKENLLKQMTKEELRVKNEYASSRNINLYKEEFSLLNYQNRKLEIESNMRARISHLENYYSVSASTMSLLFRKTRLKRLRKKIDAQKEEFVKATQLEKITGFVKKNV